MAAGVLLLAESAVTLFWQEPFTALSANQAQHRLATQLRVLDAQAHAQLASLPRAAPPPHHARRAQRRARGRTRIAADPSTVGAARFAHRLQRTEPVGGPLGRILIPGIGANFVFVQGTDHESLKEGPGHYLGTALPGLPGTVAIAGHRTTYLAPFRHLDSLQHGDLIVLAMPYGSYRYRVRGWTVVDPADIAVLKRGSANGLVLTACHPLYSAAQRIVVFAAPESSR